MTHSLASHTFPFSTVLFDVDGTLVDSAHAVIQAFQATLRAHGRPVLPSDQLRSYVGPPLYESFTDLGIRGEEQKKVIDFYRSYYESLFLTPSLFEGVATLLQELADSGIPLATATSKLEFMARKHFDHLGISHYFTVIAGADPAIHSTKATVVRNALDRLSNSGVDISRPVLVGDRKWDVEGGKETGVPVIGVRWGYAAEDEFGDVYATVSTPEDLLNLLLGHTNV